MILERLGEIIESHRAFLCNVVVGMLTIALVSPTLLHAQTDVNVEEIRKEITNPSATTKTSDEDPLKKLRELEAQEASLEAKLKTQSGASTSPSNASAPAVKKEVEKVVHVSPIMLPQKTIAETPTTAPTLPMIDTAKKETKEISPIQKAVEGVKEATHDVQEENIELRSKYAAAQKSVTQTQERCAATEKRIGTAEKNYADAQAQLQRLAKELDETRARLMVSETEVERLSARLQGKEPAGRPNVPLNPGHRDDTARQESAPALSQPSGPIDLQNMPGHASNDMPLASIISDSASLKTGPGYQYSTLMTVSQGTSLAVETRQGEWYRVITPMGARAWVIAGAVRMGGSGPKTSEAAPPSVPKVPLSKVQGAAPATQPDEAAFNSLSGALR